MRLTTLIRNREELQKKSLYLRKNGEVDFSKPRILLHLGITADVIVKNISPFSSNMIPAILV